MDKSPISSKPEEGHEALPSRPVTAEVISAPNGPTSASRNESQSDNVQPGYTSFGLDGQVDPIESPPRQTSRGERKRNIEDSIQDHPEKRRKTDGTNNATGNTALKLVRPSKQEDNAILYWAQSGNSPIDFADISRPQSDGCEKRTLSDTSWSHGVREDTHPLAHTPGSQPFLEEHGIMFNDM